MLSNIFISVLLTCFYLGGCYILIRLDEYYSEDKAHNILRKFFWPLHFLCIGLFMVGIGLWVIVSYPFFFLANAFEEVTNPSVESEK